MRVLVVSDVSGYMVGGVPAETDQLLRGLAARGHALAFVGDIASGGGSVRHFPISIPTRDDLRTQLHAALDAFRPDVVHVIAMGSRGTSQIAPLLARHAWLFTCHSAPPHERKVPVFHGVEPLHYAARFLRFLPNVMAWRWLLVRGVMPHVVVHSRFVAEIVERYGCAPRNITLVPLGFEPPAPASASTADTHAPNLPAGDAPHIVTVGGVAHTKGQHDMITALPAIAKAFPRVRYTVIGEPRDASYSRFLRERIAALGLQANVELLQGLSNEARNAALAGASLYVQPSHEEGFCLAFIEAAAVVPRLVGTDTGALRAVGEGDAGIAIVPPRAPQRLAAAVVGLLETDAASISMADRESRLRRRFAWSDHITAHEQLYARLAAAHPKGRQA